MTHTNTARPIDAQVQARAKTCTPTGTFRTWSPARTNARGWSADALASACEATGTTYSEAAAGLGIGLSAFAAMARRDTALTLTFADVQALYVTGCRRLAMRLLTDAIAHLESQTRRPGLSPADHLRVLTAKLGALASAPTDAAYAHALRDLQDRVRDALLDVQDAA